MPSPLTTQHSAYVGRCSCARRHPPLPLLVAGQVLTSQPPKRASARRPALALSSAPSRPSAGLFAADGALQQICESVIVPNLRVRPEDEEMFEMNPTEYIRRDAEGGDSDTR